MSFQLYFEQEELRLCDRIRRDRIGGMGHGGSEHGTGRDSQIKMNQDGTGRDQRARDTGRDGTTFRSSRGALFLIIYLFYLI
jgi:hypothetical protein